MTSACVVTSSDVVGSSASSSRGSTASAAAIITRCSSPPESSCGYCRRRRSASSMPTSCSSPTTRSRRPRRVRTRRLVTSASVRKSPMRRTGFTCAARVLEDHRHVRRPVAAQRVSPMAVTGEPSNEDLAAHLAPGGSSLMTAREVIDLPAPDSPTRPTASPSATLSVTSWMTGCITRWIGSSTRRSRDLEQRAHRAIRREVHGQAVAEQVEGHHGQHDHAGRRRSTPAGGRSGSRTARWPP